MTILEKIRENAARHPERLMMRLPSPDGEKTLTWGALDKDSDRLASYMEKNVAGKAPVVVYGHKDPLMIVVFLACVKSGRAYCPLDVNLPPARILQVIDEVRPEIVFATEDFVTDRTDVPLTDAAGIRHILETHTGRIAPSSYAGPEDIFYIIFTSGSSGTPKGVQITTACIDAFLSWAITLGRGVSDEAPEVFLNQAPFSFDLSVMDLFLTLYTGGTLFALTRGVQSDMRLLLEALGASGAHTFVSTPSFADVCLSDPSFDASLLPCVKHFLFCGEVLTNKTVERLMSRFPDAWIVNTYGPTESTCAVTDVIVSRALNETESPLPVGRPKKGTTLLIVDGKQQPLPDGETGEIVIAGDSVSPGYFGNEVLTREKFGTITKDSLTLRTYRTGDAGYLKDGMLYYAGRIDLQVKLHGYRIELEDIEANLLRIDGILQAAVIPKLRQGKVSSLAACVVTASPVADEKEFEARLKSQLKENLPEYMVPKKIRFLKDLPRTANGKIDRRAVGELL
ncbi:MAG: D-alanine--poly(phosphoribitol) ligase subunit DltA [Lachnospiraceae bacterium]|nr:D-alanine--poly(phosphoribitol) ligase subunit DltA [Lachnospiraceae bacterium]